MAKSKNQNISELINEFDDKFINSISLKDVTDRKGLKALLLKLERANNIITSFYETVYSDYIMMINSDCDIDTSNIDLDTVIKYKTLASKIQKAYNYINYISTFENPFRIRNKRK